MSNRGRRLVQQPIHMRCSAALTTTAVLHGSDLVLQVPSPPRALIAGRLSLAPTSAPVNRESASTARAPRPTAHVATVQQHVGVLVQRHRPQALDACGVLEQTTRNRGRGLRAVLRRCDMTENVYRIACHGAAKAPRRSQ
jgi:hypothetical protein